MLRKFPNGDNVQHCSVRLLVRLKFTIVLADRVDENLIPLSEALFKFITSSCNSN